MEFHERFWSKVEVAQPWECWGWKAGVDHHGYGQFSIDGHKNGSHRIAWQIINGDIPDGMYICHHCDNPACTNPAHLFLGTAKDNASDRDQKGRGSGGWSLKGGHVSAKLSDDEVVCILQMFDDGVNRDEIADEFSTSRRNVDLIGARRTWRHITIPSGGNGDTPDV